MITLSFWLRQASLRVRISVFLCLTLLTFALIAICLFVFSDPVAITLCALPVALASWMFPSRVSFSWAAGLLVLAAGLLSLKLHTIFWPDKTAQGFALGILVILLELCCFHFLAFFVDTTAKAQVRSHPVSLQLTRATEQQQLEAMRDQFLMSISHELRTPLTEVKGYVNLLLEYGDKIDSSTRTTFLQSASYGCDEFELIIANMLDTARLGTSPRPLRNQTLPLETTILEICENIHFPEHTLQLDLQPDLIFCADRQQFRQILRNLLSNASKYSPSSSIIRVSASEWEDESGQPLVRICVQDTGAGIPPDAVALLFQKFSRLPRDVQGSTGGTGLGLFICKQFVEGMGGRIWVESEGSAGQGSCFYFTLPRSVDPPHAQEAEI
ncbi:sensor histidine kinase [Dictyobacter arantiisoli]|uniref:histidine kinase n=1 Tax=Dictyobacter arantiisoli TaxID=2014874 RepID=A0A5A5THR5_9CHLR|nr:ATP-binding protein [Dictyobacter arantiisoli]GCF11131.1 hypothetical protein KDI_46950 [Dictyobacter arantiisoli]